MKFRKFISNKKLFGLIIAIIICISGVIPLLIFTFFADPVRPYTVEQITLTSADSTQINALVYTPMNRSGKLPGIVVAHGFCENKQFMNEISIELVKRQFVVISIDFRGHGSSAGYLPSLNGASSNELVEDVMAAVNYLKSLSYVGRNIGLVGHSMGGTTVSRLAANKSSEFNATVSIGMIPENKNSTRIRNLLIALGQFEEIFSQSMGIEFLKHYTNLTNVIINHRYGNFSRGNASELFIGMGTEHLFEVKNPFIIYEIVKWFELAFFGRIRWPINITSAYYLLSYLISIFGIIGINFVLVVYLKGYLWKNKPLISRAEVGKGHSIMKLMIGYLICEVFGAISIIFLSESFSDVLPVSLGNVLFAEIFGNAIGIVIVTYLLIMRKEHLKFKDFPMKIKELTSKNAGRSSIYGIISAILFITTITSISNWSNSPIIPTSREVGTIFGMTILFIPFFLMKEYYFRTIQSKISSKNAILEYLKMLSIGIVIDNLLLVPIMLATWQNPVSTISFIALAFFVFIMFSIILQAFTTWVYMYSGRNIIGSTIFISIIYSWMIINFFPFGFPMTLI